MKSLTAKVYNKIHFPKMFTELAGKRRRIGQTGSSGVQWTCKKRSGQPSNHGQWAAA